MATGGAGQAGTGGEVFLGKEYEGDQRAEEYKGDKEYREYCIPGIPRIRGIRGLQARYLDSSHFTLTGVCRSHCIVSVTPDTSNAQAFD